MRQLPLVSDRDRIAAAYYAAEKLAARFRRRLPKGMHYVDSAGGIISYVPASK